MKEKKSEPVQNLEEAKEAKKPEYFPIRRPVRRDPRFENADRQYNDLTTVDSEDEEDDECDIKSTSSLVGLGRGKTPPGSVSSGWSKSIKNVPPPRPSDWSDVASGKSSLVGLGRGKKSSTAPSVSSVSSWGRSRKVEPAAWLRDPGHTIEKVAEELRKCDVGN